MCSTTTLDDDNGTSTSTPSAAAEHHLDTIMGCASSTPLMNGSAGGIVEAAKHAAGDVAHAGEEAMHGNIHTKKKINNATTQRRHIITQSQSTPSTQFFVFPVSRPLVLI